MHTPEKCLTLEVVSRVASGFAWPAPYSLEDCSPDGVLMKFPMSRFLFAEDSDGDIVVEFLSRDTGRPGLQIGHAMLVYWPLDRRDNEAAAPDLLPTNFMGPTEVKAYNGVYNACKIMLHRLVPVIEGDFSWVAKYVDIERFMSSHKTKDNRS
jgi:hypothetical protein